MNRHRWKLFVVPFVVFMVLGSVEPKPPSPAEPPKPAAESPPPEASGAPPATPPTVAEDGWIPYRYYPLLYTGKILLTLAAVWLYRSGLAEFAPPRVSLLALAVGLLGGVVWIVICRLNLEQRLLEPLGLGSLVGLGQRSAFNPLVELADRPLAAWGFLAVRFLGLVAVVPLIEELFLRGFLVRFITAPDWWKVPFGTASRAALVAATVVPMLMHPAELFAAAVWFSAVSWLMVRTRNFWDCVAAHALTNLVLGIYVVTSGDWRLM